MRQMTISSHGRTTRTLRRHLQTIVEGFLTGRAILSIGFRRLTHETRHKVLHVHNLLETVVLGTTHLKDNDRGLSLNLSLLNMSGPGLLVQPSHVNVRVVVVGGLIVGIPNHGTIDFGGDGKTVLRPNRGIAIHLF